MLPNRVLENENKLVKIEVNSRYLADYPKRIESIDHEWPKDIITAY